MTRAKYDVETLHKSINSKALYHLNRLLRQMSDKTTSRSNDLMELLKLSMPILTNTMRVKDSLKSFSLNISLNKLSKSGFNNRQLGHVRNLVHMDNDDSNSDQYRSKSDQSNDSLRSSSNLSSNQDNSNSISTRVNDHESDHIDSIRESKKGVSKRDDEVNGQRGADGEEGVDNESLNPSTPKVDVSTGSHPPVHIPSSDIPQIKHGSHESDTQGGSNLLGPIRDNTPQSEDESSESLDHTPPDEDFIGTPPEDEESS